MGEVVEIWNVWINLLEKYIFWCTVHTTLTVVDNVLTFHTIKIRFDNPKQNTALAINEANGAEKVAVFISMKDRL